MLSYLNREKTVKKLLSFSKNTMLLIKPEAKQLVLDLFNSFHESLRFTYDRLENEIPDSLNIKMLPQGSTIYRKNTHTGQYVHYDSFAPWNSIISSILSLVTRAKRVCSVNLLPEEKNEIKKFACWNVFQILFQLQ